MILASPVRGTIALRLTAGRYYRSQRYGCVTSTYEPRLGSCGHYHRATDISYGGGACGKDVLAMAPGVVIWAAPLNDHSNAIILRHANGWATGYGHTNNIVGVGDRVVAGQHIGEMDASGTATGCHCHATAKEDIPGLVVGSPQSANDFWLDDPKYGKSGQQPDLAHGTGRGTWVDIWPLLEQNVRVRPKALDDIRIRTAPTLAASTIYAETQGGRIVTPGGVDIGSATEWRTWGGTVKGDPFQGVSNWQKMWLNGAYRYVHATFAQLSAS